MHRKTTDRLGPTFRKSTRTAWLVAGFLAISNFALAGSQAKDAKAVLKVLKGSSESAIDLMTNFVDAELGVLFAEFDVVKSNLEEGNDTFEAIRVFQALEAFQIEVVDALLACRDEFGEGQFTATQAWVASGHSLSDLPDGFRPDLKGPVQDFPKQAYDALEKRYSKIEKRLKTIRTLFESESDTCFAWHVEPPTVQLLAVTDGVVVNQAYFPAPSVDLIIATSQFAQANDARIQAGGCAGNAEYAIRLHYPASSITTFNQLADSNSRWRKEWIGFPERNMLVTLSGDPGSWGVTRSIGLR